MDKPLIYITLAPPYRIPDNAMTFRFSGWTEVDREDAPDIEVHINGRPAEARTQLKPEVRNHFPGMQVRGIQIDADFVTLLEGCDTQQDQGGFLLTVCVRSDNRERSFEYAVTETWLGRVFNSPDGSKLRSYPVPSEDLQLRVAGAAAGAFVHEGRKVALQIETILSEHGIMFPKEGRVFDFGCGPGRISAVLGARHPTCSIMGCDIDADAISWCETQIGGRTKFFVNGNLPPLEIPDEYFDLIYSISTFTHFPEDMQHAWLAELRRVLKPGGHILTTKINPFAYDLPVAVVEAASASGFAYWGEATLVDGLPDFYRLAYHTEGYVRRVWGQYLEILHVGKHDLNYTQDAVLMRRPKPSSLHWLRRFFPRR